MDFLQNHFELFDLPVTYDINLTSLSERYRDLQRAVHPDRFANASDRERRLSVQKAAQINEAYQVLKFPLSRLRYMLELQGVSFDDDRDTTLDPMFLMEQMELREALSEIRDNSDPMAALDRLQKDINQRINVILNQAREVIQNAALSDDEKMRSKQLVHKLQFLNKLQQEAEQLEESLLDA